LEVEGVFMPSKGDLLQVTEHLKYEITPYTTNDISVAILSELIDLVSSLVER
jgi:hypothetical protein